MSYRRPLLLALLLVATAAGAQEPSERVVLDRLRDSLSLSWDTAGIVRLERALIERARVERDDPIHHIRLGLIALRLSEIEPSQPHLDHALGEFGWAAELRPDWPWPWYGIGLAESRGRDRAGGFAGGLWTMLGLDRDRLAGEAFAKAIQADPAFVSGLLEFAEVALDQRIDAPIGPALDALRAATSSMVGWEPRLLLARGRLERLGGFPDSARVAFRRASLLSRRPAVAWLEMARTIPLTGSIDGLDGNEIREATFRRYLAGASAESSDIVAMYRRDIEPLADSIDLANFDRRVGDKRASWLAAWWRNKDATDLREEGSRLAEHYRRWDIALRDFRLPPFRRRYRFGIEPYRSGDGELDDRGIVYVRQGEPTLRIEWPKSRPAFRVDPKRRAYGNESWRYDRPEGSLELHFVALSDPQDYRLVATPLDLDVALDQLSAHAHELPDLNRLIRATDVSMGWVSEDVRLQVLASISIATQTDSWQRGYEEILSGRTQWFATGTRNGLPLVHIVYAVDADALREQSGRTLDPSVPVRVRAAFFDRAGNAVATLDTLQLLRVPSDEATMVAARAEAVVPPGPLRVRLGVEIAPDLGMIYPVDSIVAPRPNASELEMSAMLVGRNGQSLPWAVSTSDTAWLDAGGVYQPTDTLTVYAEGYGLTPGRQATMKVAITRKRSGLGRLLFGTATAVSLTERIRIPGSITRFRRELALNGLKPGDYALEMAVTVDGKTVKRQRGLRIEEP